MPRAYSLSVEVTRFGSFEAPMPTAAERDKSWCFIKALYRQRMTVVRAVCLVSRIARYSTGAERAQ